jgi:hypothetical protein
VALFIEGEYPVLPEALSRSELSSQVYGFVKAAVERIAAELSVTAPYLGTRVHDWMRKVSPSGHTIAFFDQPRIFPLLSLPWWLGRVTEAECDEAFHRDLVYSSVNGYYFIRLLDNVMDGHSRGDERLLPAAAFFHTEFVRIYEQYFPLGHPFWGLFRKEWMRTNEAAVRGAFTRTFNNEDFNAITVAKLAAAKIPLGATAFRVGRPDVLPRWLGFCERLARWFQMMDDLFDWHRDLQLGQQSYFLSEAQRRKRTGESVEAWVIRAGFNWGIEHLRCGLSELRTASHELGSDDLECFLIRRGERLAQDREELGAGLTALREVATILELAL